MRAPQYRRVTERKGASEPLATRRFDEAIRDAAGDPDILEAQELRRRVQTHVRGDMRRVPGPNPVLKKGLRVEPWANIFALVEGLSVLSLHPKREDAEAALLERAERHQPEADR
jgi:hypothetical protein